MRSKLRTVYRKIVKQANAFHAVGNFNHIVRKTVLKILFWWECEVEKEAGEQE